MMKRLTIVLSLCLLMFSQSFAAAKDFYQLKIYHLKSADQEQVVEEYLQKAYLPALHRAGISKAGVFKNIKSTASDKKEELLIYVLVPYKSANDISKIDQKLLKDKAYQQDGAAYLDASYNKTPYERIETILIDAFEGSPNFQLTAISAPKSERVYELRSYEGPTEKLFKSKVKMFNTGDEIGLFKRLGFNAVFYGSVIAGSRMPNLMYMTTFNNKEENTEKWKQFMSDPQFSALSKDPQYKGNVSKNERVYLYPTDYSDY